MIYNSVAEIFEDIERTRRELIGRISSLSEEQRNVRKDGNGWSVAEILEHLATVEGGVARITAKLLSQAEAEGAPSDRTLNPPVSFVEQTKAIENRKLQAPDRVHPQGVQSAEDSLAKLYESRRALIEMRSRIESVNSSKPIFPHPFFGNLNLYEWLAMIGMHEARHLRQIEAILQESGVVGD